MKGFIAAITVAGFAFILTTYFQSRRAWKSATFIQRTNALIEDQRAQAAREKLGDRWRRMLAERGWAGTMLPLAVLAAFLYLLVVLAIILIGVNSLVAPLVAIPLCFLAARISMRTLEERRQTKFRSQLLHMMNQVAAQLESGVGIEKALGQVVSQLENPLGEELEHVLAETRASRDLVSAIGDLAQRYPSRAMTMLVAALAIDQKVGGVLGPVLRQASELLEREFELTAEARAEVSQTRGEFFILVAGILGLTIYMITRSGHMGAMAYGSPIGMLILALAGSNFALGVYRVVKTLKLATGEN